MNHSGALPWGSGLWLATRQLQTSPTAQWCQQLKWSIIVFAVLSPALTLISTALSVVVSNWLCPSSVSFPVTGNSHNCRPKCPSIAGGSGDWLGRDWMLSSSGSLSAASKQRMLLPTTKARLHTRQTGGQESEYSNHRGCLFEVGR